MNLLLTVTGASRIFIISPSSASSAALLEDDKVPDIVVEEGDGGADT